MDAKGQVKFGAKCGMGSAVVRKEDGRFITGSGRYTDDVKVDNALHGYVLRSPYAHATFTIGDRSMAEGAPGVSLVLTGEDVGEYKNLPCLTPQKQADGTMHDIYDTPLLAKGTARHVGDAVAFVVADTLEHAQEAADLLEIDWDMQDAVVDTMAALADDAPVVHAEHGSNLAFRLEHGNGDKVKEVFASAPRVTELTLVNNRLVCNYMEPRACRAEWDADAGQYVLTVPSQGVFGVRGVLTKVLGVDEDAIRVITPDVGGGFGVKVFTYREYPLSLIAAKKLGRPVRWTADRTEHFVADAHGRDNVVTMKMAMDEDGRFLAMDVDLVAAMGAYLHAYGPFIPTLGMTIATGVYDIDACSFRIRGVYSHTTPTDAYRGAGRPEAIYALERLVDQCARDMGLEPHEIRARNMIKPDQLPYTTVFGRMYDTGEFEEHMSLAMERADWNGFDSRRKEAASRGKVRGIGMSTYIEACAFAGSEPAFTTLEDDGTVTIDIGTQSNGQGHETAYAQFAAEALGLEIDRIDVRQGDTTRLKAGGGTGGSRSIPLGGVSVRRASDALAEKIKAVASDQLEAAATDLELVDGAVRIVGTDRQMSLADVAAAAPEPLKADGEFKQAEATYPNGTHIAEVEIDPDTGEAEVVKYTVVDDFGATVNPLLLAGQVHGGIVQSIGQVIMEETIYSDDGQLVTASFMDYRMPRAQDVPDFHFETRNVPSTTNAMGMKGAGEAGTIGATPAVMNAIVEAMHTAYGVEHLDMPVTPRALWQIIDQASRKAA